MNANTHSTAAFNGITFLWFTSLSNNYMLMLNNNVRQDNTNSRDCASIKFCCFLHKSNPQGITKNTKIIILVMGKCDVFLHQRLIATSNIYHILAA